MKKWSKYYINEQWYYKAASKDNKSTFIPVNTPEETFSKLKKYKYNSRYEVFGDTFVREYDSTELEYVGEVCDLPPGIYKEVCYDHTYYLTEFKLRSDEFILPLQDTSKVVDEFKLFREAEELYKSLNMSPRRGVLLYGPPGTGKSTVIHSILKRLELDNCVVLWLQDTLCPSLHSLIKEKECLKVVILEELTELLERGTSDLLNFLDGENSFNNCFTIAATNYPEKLADNITKRPGRFDLLVKVSYLSPEDIKKYCSHYTKEEVPDKILNLDLTIAQLKEMVFRSLRDKINLLEAYEGIKRQNELVQREFSDRKEIGFNNDN